jgi:KUP system potassium uptake protein
MLIGQIFMPRVNLLLLVGVLFLVFFFRSSAGLASAYGIAVSGTMVVTTMLAFIVFWKERKLSLFAVVFLIVPFLLLDTTFLGANLLKVAEGGWMPLLLGSAMVATMYTWRRGTAVLAARTTKLQTPLNELIEMLERSPPHREPGTAVFLTADGTYAPTALLHNLKHNKVLHEHNVVLTVEYADTPHVPEEGRALIKTIGENFLWVVLRFGFMDMPDIPRALGVARKAGWRFDIMSTSFFLSRRSLKLAAKSQMSRWQARVFVALASGASDATSYFKIPTSRVVEIGAQVAI